MHTFRGDEAHLLHDPLRFLKVQGTMNSDINLEEHATKLLIEIKEKSSYNSHDASKNVCPTEKWGAITCFFLLFLKYLQSRRILFEARKLQSYRKASKVV